MPAEAEILTVLQEEFAARRARNRRYSLRAYAGHLKISPAALSQLMNGKRRLSIATAMKLAQRLPLDDRRAEDLIRALAPGARSASAVEAWRRFKRLREDELHVISDWYYFAILSLAETNDFDDSPVAIGHRLNIPRETARTAVERLERLKLLRRDEAGRIRPTGLEFSTTDEIVSLSVRRTHQQNLDLARASLDRDPLEKRNFSGITMAIDPRKLPQAKEKIRKFRHELCKFLETGRRTEVYRLCVQLFPLSHRRSEDDPSSN